MNEVAIRDQNALAINESTKELIQAGVSANALRTYRRALINLEARLNEDNFSLSKVS